MIKSFRDQGTEDIFNGQSSHFASKACPVVLWAVARRKLDQLNCVRDIGELAISPGIHLEPIGKPRQDQSGIQINEKYWICFQWEGDDVFEVEIADLH